MLVNLHVKNLALIDEVEVDFTKELNVLTGETGAGKSIIIGSITTALGGKVSKDMIRKGAEYALIELVFQISDDEERRCIEELGVTLEEDTLLISRKITPSRTVNRMNGESVTLAAIKKIADILIDIHGQNEQQSLLYKAKHREILDRYAQEKMDGKDVLLKEAYEEYLLLLKEQKESRVPEEERLREISFMEYELQEIEEMAIKKGEEAQLEETYRRLSNATAIGEGLGEIYAISAQGSPSLTESLSYCIRTMAKLAELDPKMQEFYDQLSDIDSLVTDFNRDISDYMSGYDTGAEELAQVEKRLDGIRMIKAKYGATTELVEKYAQKLRTKLKNYQDYQMHQDELEQKISKKEQQVRALSEEISAVRKVCASELTKKITQALIDLNFLQVQFEIAITPLDTFTSHGMDDIEFMISTNPGEKLRPIGQAASGGELSRIMLAVKAVLAEHDNIDTLIFDEIDVGISGRTAQMVAEKLAWIGRNHQVICISHLAQIAAMADTHFLIEKENTKNHTKTGIRRLSVEESAEELARILGGAKITDAVRESAREMKELAQKCKHANRS